MRAAGPIGVLSLLLLTGSAQAAELTIEFRDGLVTLVARDVSVRQILDEWAKVGQTLIVNGDQASATPVTLEIEAVPERQALDVILRTAAGYMAAPRREDNPGPSRYDRILVLAVSTPPAGQSRGAAPEAFPAPRRQTPRLQTPAPLLLPDEDPTFDLGDPGGFDLPPEDTGNGVGEAPAMPPTPPGSTPFRRVPGATPVTTVPGGASIPGVVTPAPDGRSEQ